MRQETRVQSLGWEVPLEKGMEITPVFLPGEFHGVLYSPWGHKELNTKERLSLSLNRETCHVHILGFSEGVSVIP